jgi:hypothetical protein
VSNGKRVVSFSLYGDLALYTKGAIENAELIHRIYPGWDARFYIDHTVAADTRAALIARGAKIVDVVTPSLGPMYGRFWRAWIAAEPGIECFVVRDVDSRINSREKAAVDAWIASGKTFHIMRDFKFHSRRVLAGMWGGLGGSVPSIRALTDSWGKYSKQGDNDRFMSERVFPLMAGDYICHDSCGHFSDAQPFPPHPPMLGTSYVGEIVTRDVQEQDVWRRVVEMSDKLVDANERIAMQNRIIHGLQAMPEAPQSLRMVLPLARLIRACATRLGHVRRAAKSRPDSE